MTKRSLDLRYRGQGYELNVECEAGGVARGIEAFHGLHRQRYGFAQEGRPVEIVNLRVRMAAAGENYAPNQREMVAGDGAPALAGEREIWFEGGFRTSRIYRREALRAGDAIDGPALVTEYTAATVIPPGCSAQVDGLGNLVIAISDGEDF